jgi:hypothetical protein
VLVRQLYSQGCGYAEELARAQAGASTCWHACIILTLLYLLLWHLYWQGCGYAEEVGKKEGRGFNVNVPWTSKGMGDADYLAAFDLVLDPIIAQFDPQVRPLRC